jgi:signal transduction histidine kinase
LERTKFPNFTCEMNTLKNVDFEIIFESVPGLYLILDAGLTISAVSNAYLAATMTERQQILGKNLFEVFPDNPDDLTATGATNLRASLNFVIQHKKPHTMAVQKYDIRKPDGTFEEKYWSPLNKPVLDNEGKIIYIIHRVEDVTEFVKMKQADEAKSEATEQLRLHATAMEHELYSRAQELQNINKHLLQEIEERKIAEKGFMASRMLLQSTLESHKDVLIFSIDKNYRYVNFNSAFKTSTAQAYGTQVEFGMSLLDTFTSDADRVKAKLNCDRALAGESHITIEEFGDVNRFYFETRYDPILDEKGEIFGVTVLSSNITERKINEEQIKSLNRELDAFTYSVAHDLRAPLRVIDGYCEVLKDDYAAALGDDGKRLLDIISANARQMGQLIDDLLNFSRVGKLSVNCQRVDMDTMMREIINEQLTLIEKDRIEFRISTLEPIICDSNLIRYVLTNLISNSIKYSRKKDKALIEIGSARKNTEIVYFVKDNGSGFDMQYADKLFGVFQRLHKMSDFEGTGVGLAIVHRIILKHGGRVWAEAAVDKGATFYFSLPLNGFTE